MLPKINRLTQKEDFRQVLKLRKFIHGRFFTIAIKKDEGNLDTKVGIIVSNKVSKKAVTRNKIKRIVRQAAREVVKKNPKEKMIVVLAKPNAANNEKEELEKDISQAFAKIK